MVIGGSAGGVFERGGHRLRADRPRRRQDRRADQRGNRRAAGTVHRHGGDLHDDRSGRSSSPACTPIRRAPTIVKENNGSGLTAAAFGSILWWFPYVLTVVVVLFAYSTLISWSYYGERCWSYLFGERTAIVYKCMFIGFIFLGSIVTATNLLVFSDLMILSMAFPNIVGVRIIERQSPPAPRRLLATLQGRRTGTDRERNERSTPMKWLPRNTVVVPVDFSEDALAAFETAHGMVKDPAHLHAIHVLPLLEVTDPGVIWETIDDESRRQHAEAALREQLSKLGAERRGPRRDSFRRPRPRNRRLRRGGRRRPGRRLLPRPIRPPPSAARLGRRARRATGPLPRAGAEEENLVRHGARFQRFTAIPRPARYSFICRIVNLPKWAIEATSTASALPSTIAS